MSMVTTYKIAIMTSSDSLVRGQMLCEIKIIIYDNYIIYQYHQNPMNYETDTEEANKH